LFGAGAGTLDSYGSAVLISEDGHLVTVWNHLVNTGYLNAVVADGRRFNISVVGTSRDHDLAVLKLDCDDDETFPFIDWKQNVAATPGESVLGFSNMFHVATGNEPVSIVHGVVACEAPLDAGLGRWQLPVKTPVYVLDAITNNSGAAGGLLTNTQGKPLGLLGREIRHRGTDMWVNYAVPWKTLKPAVSAILSGQQISSAAKTNDRKMVSYRDLTARFGVTMLPGIVEKTPAYVDRIIPDSPAAGSGLMRGDLILMIDDQVVQSVNDFRAALAEKRRAQTVTLTVNRDSQLETAQLRIP